MNKSILRRAARQSGGASHAQRMRNVVRTSVRLWWLAAASGQRQRLERQHKTNGLQRPPRSKLAGPALYARGLPPLPAWPASRCRGCPLGWLLPAHRAAPPALAVGERQAAPASMRKQSSSRLPSRWQSSSSGRNEFSRSPPAGASSRWASIALHGRRWHTMPAPDAAVQVGLLLASRVQSGSRPVAPLSRRRGRFQKRFYLRQPRDFLQNPNPEGQDRQSRSRPPHRAAASASVGSYRWKAVPAASLALKFVICGSART